MVEKRLFPIHGVQQVETTATSTLGHVMREDTIVEQATAKEITHKDVEMVHRFGAEFRRADESYVSALSLMAPVFELPLSDVTVVDGEKAVLECRYAVAVTPAAEVTWYVENVEIRQTDGYQIRRRHFRFVSAKDN